MTPEDLVAHYRLEPIPREGGRFRRTWAGPERTDGRPEGTAIMALITAEPDDFSALHRLPADEVWHFYLGDPLELLLLAPDRSARTAVLGPDVLGGRRPEDIGDACVFLASPLASWITGHDLVVDGGVSARPTW
ncbi:SDR family oxidoreductase [Streptomyces avermitilis]|uniref:SDR family oxidoreductase n=1 Tax=Streptomyces avermitilis TaxID=33903 RepID=UPI0033A20BBE